MLFTDIRMDITADENDIPFFKRSSRTRRYRKDVLTGRCLRREMGDNIPQVGPELYLVFVKPGNPFHLRRESISCQYQFTGEHIHGPPQGLIRLCLVLLRFIDTMLCDKEFRNGKGCKDRERHCNEEF